MPRNTVSATEAARRLGISLDTLRRWDKQGLISTTRDSANRRLVSVNEIQRLQSPAEGSRDFSARNRFRGVVTDVKVEGLLAQVELEVTTPIRVVSVITREAAEQLGVQTGIEATALVKATSVMVET